MRGKPGRKRVEEEYGASLVEFVSDYIDAHGQPTAGGDKRLKTSREILGAPLRDIAKACSLKGMPANHVTIWKLMASKRAKSKTKAKAKGKCKAKAVAASTSTADREEEAGAMTVVGEIVKVTKRRLNELGHKEVLVYYENEAAPKTWVSAGLLPPEH